MGWDGDSGYADSLGSWKGEAIDGDGGGGGDGDGDGDGRSKQW
jgi:hypothetical protein